jgi:outer membrane protein TolC
MTPIKYMVLAIMLSGLPLSAISQKRQLTLDECYAAAEKNYPLVKQRALIANSSEFSLDNLSKGRWPQLVISGQATYQSDVTQIPVNIPGQEIPTISKDQYRLYGEISQPLTDLVTVTRQKEIQVAASKVQEQNLEVELYKTRERINQLFFGVLLIDEQLKQNELFLKDIQTGIDKTSALVANGSEFKSNLDKLKAELLRADQRGIELRSSRRAYTSMLALFMNESLAADIVLTKPGPVVLSEAITRPELRLFQYQKLGYQMQDKLIDARNLPKFSLFFQGGVGRPSPVNLLSNDITPYYIGGLRLNWSIASFYTSSKEKQMLKINERMVDAQQETFVFNTNVSLSQQRADIARLQELIGTDDEIIRLRSSVKEASKAQLDHGVITVNDYLREVNAEDQARQNKLLHEIQLSLAQYSYQTTVGPSGSGAAIN